MTWEMVSLAWADLRGSLERLPLVAWLGWRDALLPFRGAVIGPYWITLYVAIWSFGIAYIFKHNLGAQEPHYLVYVAIGVTLFTVLTTFFNDGSQAFVKDAKLILNVPNPLSIYILKLAVRGCIEMVLSLPVIAVAMILTGLTLQLPALLALPGLVLILLFGVGFSLLLASLATRFRDLGFAVRALMRFMIFLTPVFWIVTSQSGPRALLAELNPFYHLITIVRDPLLGSIPSMHHYVISLACATCAALLGFLVFAAMRGRMAAWL